MQTRASSDPTAHRTLSKLSITALVLGIVLLPLVRATAQTWIQLSPPPPLPSPRNVHSAVYDTATNRMIIFGAGGNGFSNDVWVLTNANGLKLPYRSHRSEVLT